MGIGGGDSGNSEGASAAPSTGGGRISMEPLPHRCVFSLSLSLSLTLSLCSISPRARACMQIIVFSALAFVLFGLKTVVFLDWSGLPPKQEKALEMGQNNATNNINATVEDAILGAFLSSLNHLSMCLYLSIWFV